ncbi:MAG: arylesterase [Rhodospirillaceae bacterium]|nr:MAG: arylesterase [Rhodospirillaceae bacterium]
MRTVRAFLLSLACLLTLACLTGFPFDWLPDGILAAGRAYAQDTISPPAGSQETQPKLRILAFGDSLTAGYGLSEAEGFTVQLAQALAKMGRPAEVINGGVSGDTTAGGLARIDWALADKPQIVLLELGANDMLRGLPPAAARANLEQIIAKAKAANTAILLIGMRAPANLGADYQRDFDAIYPDLAKAQDLPLYPFILDGVAGDPALNQADGIHPNAEGVAIIVKRLLPSLVKVMDTVQPADKPGASQSGSGAG